MAPGESLWSFLSRWCRCQCHRNEQSQGPSEFKDISKETAEFWSRKRQQIAGETSSLGRRLSGWLEAPGGRWGLRPGPSSLPRYSVLVLLVGLS